jgi:hypothetical protein
MLVHRPRLKTQGAVVTTVAMLALSACDDPTARTDLRPEGPPDVLAVLVLNDALGGLVESAAYCKPNDEKRPSLVGLPDFTTQQICPEELSMDPDPLTNAAPELWYVRVMFDELLDPDVEDLIPVLDENDVETGVFTGTLRSTQPVTLQCQDVGGNFVDIEYDGYYSPSGNAVTWPLGPSLVVKPLDPTLVPVESECRITLKDTIRDKAGNAPDKLGPFSFKIAPVEIISIAPPGGTVAPEFGGVDLTFNVEVDASSFDPTMFSFTPELANAGVAQYDSNGVFVFGDMIHSTSYEFAIAEGTKMKDKCGKESTLAGDNLETSFKTSALALVNVVPFQGPGAIPARKIRINFNQTMDRTTIGPEDYEWLTEEPEGFNFAYLTEGGLRVLDKDATVIVLAGQYKLGTNYKFRLKAGAKIADCPSQNTVGNCTTTTGELTVPEDVIVDITTATAISNTAISMGAGSTTPREGSVTTISGAGGQTIHKNDAIENVFVQFTFNQDMEGASLDAAELTLTKADGTPTGVAFPAAAGFGTDSITKFNLGALPAGAYKLTLKQGATILDRLSAPNTFTQAADRTFTFNVVVDSASAPFTCIGAP